jgi:uncharacterized protein (DUF58 family)
VSSLLDSDARRWLKRLQLQVDGRVRATQRGERRSLRRGSGGDFVDTRAYAPGDDLRHLDWHAYARLDQLLIRLYEAPKDHALHILLDVSPSMAVDNKLTYARRLSAALGFLTLTGGDRVSLTTFSQNVVGGVGPLRSARSVATLLQFLDGVQTTPAQGGTDLLPPAKRTVAARRKGTVVLLSDLLADHGDETLRTLAAARVRVAVLHVMSPQERDPDVGRDFTLVDSETAEELTVQIDERLKTAYLQRLAAYTDALRARCTGYGFAFIDISTGTPIEELLFGDLRRRGLVR